MGSTPSQHIPRRPPRASRPNADFASPDADAAVLAAFTEVMGRPPASPEELDRYRRYLLGFVIAAETIALNASLNASIEQHPE